MTEQASEQSIFLHAIGLPSPSDRVAYLDLVCRDNPALRKELDALLAAHDRLGGALSPTTDQGRAGESAAEAARSMVSDSDHETVGTVVSGRYKLLEQIGEGGMGSVWMAQQTEPVKRLVALKVIKPGMDSKQVLARFEAERQALALMEHPNIARVFDAGTVGPVCRTGPDSEGPARQAGPTGRPFFVMELVKGVPITRYCDEHRLTPKDRLELFLPVCQAIQHAHQKGIIHRDIKPSNVLVASYDGKPVPKVIDFGIAKATGQQLTERTLVTGFGTIVGTLEYMSPEQAEMNALDIDTRSDIYSLGVLLYELLTGSTPLEKKRLREAAMLEVLRLIREEEPPRPSTRLSTTDELPAVAANRGLEPKKLSGLVRGELDWIVMKALDKDRNRRYETANGFAMDVQRYLADEAVQACPPSMGYRLRKFVRRNKGPVLAAGVFVVLLFAGIVGTTAGLVRALAAERRAVTERDDKEEARQQTRQALNTMTDAVMEDLLGRQVQLTERHRRFLKNVLAQHEAFAAAGGDDPSGRESRAQGYFRVGRIRYFLGELTDAEAAYRAGLALQKELVNEDPNSPKVQQDLAASHDNLGLLLRETGRLKEAETEHHDALALMKTLVDDRSDQVEIRRDLARVQLNLGIVLREEGRLKEAEGAYANALDLLKQLASEFPDRADVREKLAMSHNNVANVLVATGRLSEAKAAYANTRSLYEQLTVRFPDNPDFRRELAMSHHNLSSLLRVTGRTKEAEEALRKALDIMKQLANDYGSRPDFRMDLARSYIDLGQMLRANGRPKEAEAVWSDAVAVLKRLTGDLPTRPDVRRSLASSYQNLGSLLVATGRFAEAETVFDRAVMLAKPLARTFPDWPASRHELASNDFNRAIMLRATGRPKEAEEAYRAALSGQTRLAADFPEQIEYRHSQALTLHNLGFLLCQQKRFKEAESVYHKALTVRKRLADEFPDQPQLQHDLAFTYNNLGSLLQQTARPANAEEAYRKALAIRKQLAEVIPDQHEFRHDFARVHNNLGVLMVDQKNYAEAKKFYDTALALHKRLVEEQPTLSDNQNDLALTLVNIAILYNHQEKFAAAVALIEKARPHHLAALKANPREPAYREAYVANLRTLIWSDYGQANHARMAATANELAGLGYDPANDAYLAATYLGVCATIVETDSKLTEATRKELAKSYGDQALALLHKAVTRGFRNAAQMRQNPGLEPLRKREEFRKLLADLEKKDKR